MMGVEGGASSDTDVVELEPGLLFLLCRALASPKQWLQVRDGGARGLKFASWSRGSAALECQSQKMLPHLRQWWRRMK